MKLLTGIGRWSSHFLLLHLIVSFVTAKSSSATIDYWQFSRSPCPQACSAVGPNPAGWTYYHDANALSMCNETYIFEMNLYNPVADPSTHLLYRACTASTSTFTSAKSRRQFLSFNIDSPTEVKAAVHLTSWGTATSSSDLSSVSAAVNQLSSYLQENTGYSTPLFARSGNVVAGMYVGVEIEPTSAASIAEKYLIHASSGISTRQAAQVCHTPTSPTEAQIFGVIVDTTGDLAAVQSALASWNNATCVTAPGGNTLLENTSIQLIPGTKVSIGPDGDHVDARRRSELTTRATCQYLEVESGDTCSSLATSCAISLSQFESYNTGVNCKDLQLNTYVCCSTGTPPNFAPQPYPNGTCYTYAVQSGDYCSSIATAHQMNVNVIETSNNNTWGWMGCTDLFIGQTICLSSGNPPYPANVPNSVCGPQVNNTLFTANYTSWSTLNPCPLKACCDIYGQCGITTDFCTPGVSTTGAPGTAAVGSNGCISNCGTQIVASSSPSTFARMGYFEAFNNQRPCMNMDPTDIPSYYTHVHFAFANFTSSYEVDLTGEEDFFQDFLNTDGFSRVLSFGGWAFSTDPSTYPIFRQGVTAANRLSFAQNVANFIQGYNLQGVDFDWEYPGPSITPGIPSGSPEDGANYLAFLQTLRPLLPKPYTISITAPASFYYLQNFPIEEMSAVVDYIVFMTYDLHGQWDYGNLYTDPGCPAGNCLRSQTNMTETQSALSMITKAGVPANMIMFGQPLYGRSFQMTTAGCYTEECTYTGPNSGALAGPCTGTPSYIGNWEINQIISNSQFESSVEEYYSDVAGDILVYDSTQWVSWMKPSTYNSRSAWVQGLNFGGTCDWAMDLNASYAANGSQIGEGSGVIFVPPSIYSSAAPTVTCLPPCTFVFPPWTLSTAMTISIPPTTMTISEIWPSVTTESNGVTSTVYLSSTTVTTITIPAITTSTISVWNVEWTNTATPTLYLTSSIIPPPVTLTQSGDKVTTTTLPGIIYTFAPGPYPPVSSSFPPNPNPPPGFGTGIIPIVVGPPGPGGCEIGCGGLCLIDCEPSVPCIGICGCIGLGCPGGGDCIGPSCGGGGGGGGDGGDDGNESTTTCATSKTVTDCKVACSVTDYGDASSATNCYTTACSTVVGCQTTGVTTTSVTVSAICPSAMPTYPPWTPVSGAQIPIFVSGTWSTPGATSSKSTSTTKKPTSSPSKTTTKPSSSPSKTSTVPPPSSASPSQIILFTDSKCQDKIGSGSYDFYSSNCWDYSSPINSYIVGTTDNCGCPGSEGFCEWDTFVITTSTGCGYDDEVGGGCSGGGGQVPTKCYATTGPAKYITAEIADNGICRFANGTTAVGDDGDGVGSPANGTEARAAGRLSRRAPAC